MSDRLSNFTVGAIGTAGTGFATYFATMTPDKWAAFAAGTATALWMLWQLGVAIFDRIFPRK